MKPILAILAALTLSACSTIRPGSQSAEVRAEQTLAVSLAALDSFVAFEHRRRADVPPLVRDIAARVRREAPKALDSANALRLAYKGSRNAQNEANLLTALNVVDALVGEIRVWVPVVSASGPGRNAVADIVREARASQTVTTESWVALVPVFIDLAREVWAVVNRTRDAVKQDREWSLAEEADFAAKLHNLKTAEHWKG
jgi:hypothetical protein